MARLAARLCRSLLGCAGWTVDILPPPGPKGVVIVYPHTSNWDFVIGFLAGVAAGLELRWLGKEALFRRPLGVFFRSLGGIARRGTRAGLVAQLAAEYARRERIWLAVAPEGTRAFTDHWKSGFYHLALAVKTPVGLASLDYARRRVELRTYVVLTGDPAADVATFRERYAGVRGLYPACAGEIRFGEETRGR